MDNKANILICDPAPESELSLDGMLVANEYEVVAGKDGHDVLDKAKSLAFDLVIVASDTPGIDGFQVCRLLKESERTRHIPAMIVSALTNQIIRNQAIEAGADEFIVKPLNKVELLARVVALLRIKKLHDKLSLQIRERETENRKLTEKSRELGILSEIARIVISTRDRRGILTEIINNIREAFGVDGSCLVTRKNGNWILEVLSGNLSSPFAGKPVGEIRGLYDYVGSHEKPLVIDNLRDHPLGGASSLSSIGVPMFSTMASPIFVRGELIAIVQLFNRNDLKHFSGGDLPLLMTISGQIGLAIENMQLFEKLSEFNENLQRQIEQATQALLEMKNFNESILQNVSSGILTIDFSGQILFANRASRAILELANEEILNQALGTIFGKEIAENLMRPTMDRDHQPASAEIRMRTRTGREIYLGYTTTVRYDSDRRMLGYIISFRDITQIKELRQTVMRMDRLAASGILTSAIAHEIRNPLAGIKTMAQALEKELDESDARQEYVERIVKQINRLNDLLKSFFTYAKPVRPEKKPCDLRNIIREIVALTQERCRSDAIEIEQNYGDTLTSLFADENQMQQVFMNLIMNAMDAVEHKGKVTITSSLVHRSLPPKYYSEIDLIEVRIADTGPGIPANQLKMIFDPFFTTKPNGIGLGLSIVYRIVDEHGGDIRIESEPGKGTTFCVYLPAEELIESVETGAFNRPVEN